MKSAAQLKQEQRANNKAKKLVRFERSVTEEEKQLLIETLKNHRALLS